MVYQVFLHYCSLLSSALSARRPREQSLSWLRGPLKDFTRDTLLGPDSACRDFFDSRVLEEIVCSHEKGSDRQQELWTLIVFEAWHKMFVAPRKSMEEQALVA